MTNILTHIFLILHINELSRIIFITDEKKRDSVRLSDCIQTECGRFRTQIQVFSPLAWYPFCYKLTKFRHHDS